MYLLEFVKGFITSPKHVGAVVPSSSYLADRVTEAGGVREASVVVEWGPGTGAITGAILERLPDDATFFGIEISPDFCRAMGERFPNVTVYQDSAAETRKYLEERGFHSCDSVVSGLPWASFEDALQDELLEALVDVLRPGGKFVTYTYFMSPWLPAGRKFRRKLQDRFQRFDVLPLEWRNVPPAYVYVATK